MAKKNCFESFGDKALTKKYDDLVEKGVNPLLAARQVILEEQEILAKQANELRKALGVKTVKFTPPQDITDAFNAIQPPTPQAVGETVEVEEQQEEQIVEPQIQQAAKVAGVKAKNIRGLYDINRKMFGQDRIKSIASAIVMDRMIGAMAKRAGIPKNEMYSRIKFEKSTEESLPQGVKKQVDAWHGSPYQFDKFELSKIGTGEGAQAFGWGLYFTDLEGIARDYADKLTFDPKQIKSEIEFTEKQIEEEEAIIKSIENSDLAEKLKTDLDRRKSKVLALKQNLEYLNKKTNLSKNLYKVSLHKGKNPSEYTWLEWDKPLSEDNFRKIKAAFKSKGYILNNENNESFDLVSKKGLQLGHYHKSENGSTIYNQISKVLSSKDASLLLLENGIDGIKYPAESIARGATSDTARGSNYVVFDENAVSIEEVIKFQRDAEKTRGAAMVNMDGTAVIYALTDPNVTTPLHELAHVFEHYLSEAEKNTVIKSAKTKGWTTETSEYFARGFEKYLAEGKSPIKELQNLFDKFKQWLTDIYNGITDSQIDVQLNRPMRKIYSQMLGKEIQPPKDLSPTERENLINIANKVGVNFREVQNVYNKYTSPSERKPLDQITEADYVKAQTARLTSPQDQANFKDTFISKLNALKEKFKSLEKGRKQGIMSQKALISELQSLAKEYDKATEVDKSTKSPRTERTLRNRRGNIRSFKDLDAYKRYVDKVVKDGNYADKVAQAKALAKKIANLKDNKKLTATDKAFIASLNWLNPKYVLDLDGYIDLLTKFEKSFKDTTFAWATRKADMQNFMEREGAYIEELLAAIAQEKQAAQELDDIADAQAAIEEGLYNGTVGDYLNDLALSRQTTEDLKNEEQQNIAEARERINEALVKKSERDEAAVKGLFNAMKGEVKQAFIDAGLAKDFNEIAQWANSTSSPTKTMSSEKSLLLSNILQNVFEDGDFTGLQTVTGEISAINKSDEIAALKPTFRRLNEKRKKGYTIRTAMIALTQTVDMLRKIQDTFLGGWEGIVARGRKKHIELMGQFKALTKEYGIDTLASQMKIDTYAFINQWFSDLSDADADIAFQQRYAKRALDSKYIFNQTYKNAGKRKIIQGEKARESINAMYQMGLITDPQFTKNDNGSESVEFDVVADKTRADIQNALTPNEKAMYDFVMRVFESMKPQVQMGATIGQNQQWRDITNYYPTITDGMNLDADEMANRLSYANSLFGFSKTSGNAKSRVDDISKIKPENRLYRQGLHDMFSLGTWENIMIADASKERNYISSILSDQSPMRKILGDREFKMLREMLLSKYSKDLTHGWVRQDEPTLAFEYSRALAKAVASFILVRPAQILKQSTGIISSATVYPKQTYMAMKLLMELASDPRGRQLIENTSALGRDPIFLQDIHSAEFPMAYFNDGAKKTAVKGARSLEAAIEDIGDIIMPIAASVSPRIEDNSFFKFIDRMNTKVVAWAGFVDQIMRENNVDNYNDVRAIILDQLNRGELSPNGIQAAEDFVAAINSESNQSNLPDELTKNRLLYFMKSFAYITSGHALENFKAYREATTKEDKEYYLNGVKSYVYQAVAFAAISYVLSQVPKLWDDDEEELSEEELMKREYENAAGISSKLAGLISDLSMARSNVFGNIAMSIATNLGWYLWSDAESKEMIEQDPDFNEKMLPKTISIEPKAGGAFTSFLENLYRTGIEGGKEISLLSDAELPKSKSTPTFIPPSMMMAGQGTLGEVSQMVDKKQDEEMRKIWALHKYGLKGKDLETALEYLKDVKSENISKHVFVLRISDIGSQLYIINDKIFKEKYGREYQKKMREYADMIKPKDYKTQKDKVADIRKKRREWINQFKVQYAAENGRLELTVNKTDPSSMIVIPMESGVKDDVNNSEE
jgi:hypothetical protein